MRILRAGPDRKFRIERDSLHRTTTKPFSPITRAAVAFWAFEIGLVVLIVIAIVLMFVANAPQ